MDNDKSIPEIVVLTGCALLIMGVNIVFLVTIIWAIITVVNKI